MNKKNIFYNLILGGDLKLENKNHYDRLFNEFNFFFLYINLFKSYLFIFIYYMYIIIYIFIYYMYNIYIFIL